MKVVSEKAAPPLLVHRITGSLADFCVDIRCSFLGVFQRGIDSEVKMCESCQCLCNCLAKYYHKSLHM